jgi:hypothetical protein
MRLPPPSPLQQLLQDAAHLGEKFPQIQYIKFIFIWGRMGYFTYGVIV